MSYLGNATGSGFREALDRCAVNDVHRLAMYLSTAPELLRASRVVLALTAEDDLELRELIRKVYDYWCWDGEDQVAYLDFGIGARIEIDCRSIVLAEGSETAKAIVEQERTAF